MLCLGFVLLGFVFFRPQTAWADPHAIFYTAIGQQQLFFNVLAALDQADYVELQFDREQLYKDRAGVTAEPTFAREGQLLVQATEVEQATSASDPGVSTLVNRPVTLEGADLYTDYLVRLFGAETGRRNAMSELLRALCGYGLGLADCEFDTNLKKIEEITADREKAMVLDALKWQARPFTDGVLGAAFSGTAQDKDERLERLNLSRGIPIAPRPGLSASSFEMFPLAFSPDIAKWRDYINKLPKGTKEYHERLLNDLLLMVINEYLQLGQTYPYAGLVRNERGELAIDASEIKTEGETRGYLLSDSEKIDRLAMDVLDAPRAVRMITEGAAERIRAQQELIEDNGFLADYTLLANGVDPNLFKDSKHPGELSVLVRNPVGVRRAAAESLPTLLGLLDTSQQASALQGIDIPGKVQLVQRGSGSSGSSGVRGATAADGAADGMVAGVLNLLGQSSKIFNYDAPKTPPTSPSANLIAPHLEQGAAHALRNITAGEWRGALFGEPLPIPPSSGRCGWTCPLP
ncbi:MAG: hypothetical protein HY372_04055 [Candidatus Andersenbacteria bacterium]|nr:hypothetical protein [Candidatus Andersenbacteria bacterium]